MEIILASQIGLITTVSILGIAAAFLSNKVCKRFWLAALFAAVVAGGVYTLACIIYIEVIAPEGLSYWANTSYREILRLLLRMFVPGFVVALVPALLVILWLRITKSKRITEP